MTFDPDTAPGYPRRILKGVKTPPLKPSAPVGRYSTRDLARAALLSALLRDGGWWGEPKLAFWGQDRAVPAPVARALVGELVAQGRVVESWTGPCPRWRAREACNG